MARPKTVIFLKLSLLLGLPLLVLMSLLGVGIYLGDRHRDTVLSVESVLLGHEVRAKGSSPSGETDDNPDAGSTGEGADAGAPAEPALVEPAPAEPAPRKERSTRARTAGSSARLRHPTLATPTWCVRT